MGTHGKWILVGMTIASLALAGAAANKPRKPEPPLTASTLMASFPKGVILPWYPGPTETVPAGWALCDGKNGTPNLQGKYLVGADDFTNITEVGSPSGAATHSHNVTTSGSGTGRAGTKDRGDNWGPLTRHDSPETTGLNHEHPVSVTVTTTGTTEPGSNLPPSVRILYIIKK